MRGGKRQGSGRKVGTPNKKTAERKAEIIAGGEMPLDYALRIMRDKTQINDRRDWACGQAMRFCHSALASTEHSGPNKGPITIYVDSVDAAA